MILAWQIARGDLVDTPLGEGTILNVDRETISFTLTDDPGRPVSYPRNYAMQTFKLLKASKPSVPFDKKVIPEQKKQESEILHSTKVESARGSRLGTKEELNALDALRFGLVPDESLEEFSMFRAEMETFYLGSLPEAEGKPHMRLNVVTGAWGEGKSHTMAYVRQRAFQDQYLTAGVEVDGKDVTLAEPGVLLYKVLSRMRGMDLDPAYPIIDIYKRALDRKYDGPKITVKIKDKRESNHTRSNYNQLASLYQAGNLEAVDDLMEMVLSGSDEMCIGDIKRELKSRLAHICRIDADLESLISSNVLPRPYDFIAALISLAHIARAAGYRGLLITFDEWEVQAQSMTKKQEERILALLQALNYFFCDSSVPKAFISFYIFDVTKSQPNEDDLLIEQLRQETKGAHYRVKIIKDWDSNNRELSSMVSRINQAYCRCYDAVSLPDSEIMSKIEDSLGNVNYHESGAMRRTIKLIISVMDSIYGPPQSQSQ